MSEVKRILFVIEDLKPGGVEVSLVNLLNLLDFETHKFKVTVIMWEIIMKILVCSGEMKE